MTQRDELPNESRLPLPSPRSPHELDNRILSYARENAPQKERSLQPAWMAGIATCCVVVLALFIVVPDQQTLHPGLNAPLPDRELERAPEPEQRTPQAAEERSVSKAKMKPSASLAAPRPAAKAAPEAALSADHATVGELADSPAAQQRVAPAVTGAGFTGSTATLHAKIQQCAQLLASGDEQQARQAYQALREQCPRCELPDKLEEAMERYLKY